MTAVLSAWELCHSYPGSTRELLRNASFSLGPEERIGLRGPNGSGKSTLLHILTGLIQPRQGSIYFDGERLASEADFRRARPRMGYLLQRTDDQLFCSSVLEDVAFGPLNLGLNAREARIRAEETLEGLGIAHLADRPGCNLSGGEQKMAALASVISMRPRLLLLDEPTNDLDPQSLALLLQTLLRLNLPCIAVSHDSDFLARLCTTHILLQDGGFTPAG